MRHSPLFVASLALLLAGVAAGFGCRSDEPTARFEPAAQPPVAQPEPAPRPAPPPAPTPPPTPALGAAQALITPTAAPAAPARLDLSETQHSLTGTNVTLADLINAAYRTPTDAHAALPRSSTLRVVAATPLPTDRYDVRIVMPGARRDALRQVLRATLEQSFGLAVTREMRPVEALHLRAPFGRLVGQHPDPAQMGEHVTLSGNRLTMLADQLEDRLGQPVINETGLVAAYWVHIPTERAADPAAPLDLAAVRRELHNQLGLELVPAPRSIEYLVVSRIGAAQFAPAAQPAPSAAPAAPPPAPTNEAEGEDK